MKRRPPPMKIISDVKKRSPFTADRIPPEWKQTLKEYKNYIPEWEKWENFHPKIQQILARPRIPSQGEQWYAERLCRLTATNLGSVLCGTKLRGHNPYMSREKLFMTKTGRPSASEFKTWQSPAVQHGHKYEAEAAEMYSKVTGIELVPEDIGMLFHQKEECISATPDRLARYYPINVEIKCPWKRQIQHLIPDYYYSQVQQQMAVLGLEETHFVQYRPGVELDIVIVKFDPKWWTEACREALLFWEEVKKYYEGIQKPIGSQLQDWTPPDLRKKKRVYNLQTDEITEENERPAKLKKPRVPDCNCIVES